MNKVVYRHRCLDNNTIFYVGMGSVERAYSKHGRSKWWKNITNTSKYCVEIISEKLSKESACELEELLILEYGRKDLKKGALCNMTDGGDGVSNRTVTKEVRSKIKKSLLGRKYSKQRRKNMSEGCKGRTNISCRKKVSQHSLNGELIQEYDSLGEASKKVSGLTSHISSVCNGRRKTHKGFIWKFI